MSEMSNHYPTDIDPCGKTQTMSHTVESCPLTKLNGGLFRLHSADEDTVSWLTSYYGSWNAYEKKTTPHPGLSKRRRHRSSHHCLICHCIRMQQFSKSSEMLTISCSHKIHDDTSNGSRVAAVTKKQADTHTHPQTDITANNTIFAMLSLFAL